MAMTNRQTAAMETRKRLLEAGKRMICEKGLDQTSIEEITREAGVSKGTFYTYFRRKEEIVFELSWSRFGELLEQAKAGEGGFVRRLSGYMIGFSGCIEQSGVRLAQDWVKNVVGPEPGGNDRKKLDFDREAVGQLFAFGVREGLLKEDTPVPALAGMLVDLLYGELLCWCMSDGSYSLRERTEAFCGGQLETLLGQYVNI